MKFITFQVCQGVLFYKNSKSLFKFSTENLLWVAFVLSSVFLLSICSLLAAQIARYYRLQKKANTLKINLNKETSKI